MTDLTNYHPHSRYTIHEKADLYPFLDLIWRRPDGPFIDLKVDYPDPTNNYADGTAYLRVEDVIEMARVLGMATREDVDALKKENAELKAKLNELPTKVESYKNELHRVTSDFVASLDNAVHGVVLPVEVHPEPESIQPTLYDEDFYSKPSASEGDVSGNRDSSDSDESAAESSDEPIVSERPDELSSTDSNQSDPLATFLGLGNPKE